MVYRILDKPPAALGVLASHIRNEAEIQVCPDGGNTVRTCSQHCAAMTESSQTIHRYGHQRSAEAFSAVLRNYTEPVYPPPPQASIVLMVPGGYGSSVMSVRRHQKEAPTLQCRQIITIRIIEHLFAPRQRVGLPLKSDPRILITGAIKANCISFRQRMLRNILYVLTHHHHADMFHDRPRFVPALQY